MNDQQELTPTPASAWKNKLDLEGTDLLLPSENVARVKQVSPGAFITSDLIPDPLTAIVRTAINSKRGLPPSKVKQMMQDPKKMRAAMEMFDRVLVEVVIEPKVQMPPICTVCEEYHTEDKDHEFAEGVRDPDVLYADTVSYDDKTFIFQWCLGGTRKLEPFREQLAQSVESLQHGEDVPDSAE